MPVIEPPNHHADFPGFAGMFGIIAGLSMAAGRGDIARIAVDIAGVTPSDRVVDVGCGPGTAVREAARRGAQVWGIDPARVMLRIARLLTLSPGRITWYEGVAEALPLKAGIATVLWSVSTVHHWSNLEAGISEAFRVLAPGGRLLAIEREREPGTTGMASHGWTNQQAHTFAEHCAAAGFIEPHVASRRIGQQDHLIVTLKRPV